MSEREHRFIFDWRKKTWDYSLFLFIGVALLGHFFCFYLFHVVYPTTTSLLPPSAQITVLNTDSPRDKNFLSWIEMNEPSSVSAPRFNSALVQKLIPAYKPIFATLVPQLALSTLSKPPERLVPSIFSAESFLPMRMQPVESAEQRSFATQLEIGSTLGERMPKSFPSPPLSNLLSDATSLFIGIDPSGEPDYIFLRRSSGNPELDQEAERFIRTLRFLANSARSWGVVTFRWGGPGK
jgi:TonB family protein